MANNCRNLRLLLYLRRYNLSGKEVASMALTKRLNPVGNSAGLTFDKPILKQVGWELGNEIELRVEGETIVLTKHHYAAPGQVGDSAKRMIARHGKSLD